MNASLIKDLRQDARRQFMLGLKAADPALGVRDILKIREDLENVEGALLIIALGKAACPMMKEAMKWTPKTLTRKALPVKVS